MSTKGKAHIRVKKRKEKKRKKSIILEILSYKFLNVAWNFILFKMFMHNDFV